MKTYHLAVFPADGIGPEVIAASQQVLRQLAQLHGGLRFETRELTWGSAYYAQSGTMMPPDGLQQLERAGFDALLMGPVGSPRIPDHITLWGLLLPIRQGFDQYINLRPLRLLPGVVSPLRATGPQTQVIDMVCVRENSEGEYAGVGGRVHRGRPQETAVQSTIFTRTGTERVVRFAFDYARQHGRRLITNVTKSNSMQHNMVFWDDVFKAVAADYPDLATDQQLVDSMTARLVRQPESVDVFVASNLFGDILSDLGAALTGSLGLAPSANLNPERRYPSLFQAIHGSAFDLAGRNVANPLASIWSVQLMLEFLGEAELAARLMRAIEAVLQAGRVRTPDLGGTSSTTDVTAAVCKALRAGS